MLAISRIRLVPQNDRFFDLFNLGARNTLEGAKVLADLLDSFEDIERKARRLKDIEHSGDEITHAVLGALNRTFITPLDREDITHLSAVMDDVIDWIEHVAHRVWLYRLTEVTPLARRFGQVILEQADQIARTACTYSRMRGAGGDHVTEKRRSLWARTWLPSPRVKRPPVPAARSQPTLAQVMGERAKAMATLVCSSMRLVAAPATANDRNGSCLFSWVVTPV